jgi:hypothetical protein
MTLMSPENLFASFKANPPAGPDAVSQCQSNLKFLLPADYVSILGADEWRGGLRWKQLPEGVACGRFNSKQ